MGAGYPYLNAMRQGSIIRKPLPFRFYNATLILIGINVFVFLIQRLYGPATSLLGLYAPYVLQRGYVWQIFTYMFTHGSFQHILFNMFGLFMFGTQLEKQMGSSEFLMFYLFAGVGAGVFTVIINMNALVVGASGAIFALLLAFATYFPRSRILFFYFIPMPAPLAVAIFAVLSIVMQVTGLMGGIAHLAHLAGIVLGYIYFVVRLGINPIRVFLDSR